MANQKRSIRRKASKIILCGGEIFLARKERGKVLVSILLIIILMEFFISYCVLSHFAYYVFALLN